MTVVPGARVRTPRPANVRLAVPDDAEAVYDFLVQMRDEIGFCKLDKSAAMETIRRGTDHGQSLIQLRDALVQAPDGRLVEGLPVFVKPQGGVIGLIEGPRGIEASLGCMLDHWWYSTDYVLQEKWHFVHPDFRRTTHAKSLIEFAKWAAEDLGIPLIIGIANLVRTEAKVRLYRRQLTLLGGLFCHNVSWSPKE